MTTQCGILGRGLGETPIAILDFETTGFTAGYDRVVELAVVRVDPGEKPRLVMDTLVNPGRSLGATDIHGIAEADVVDAPRFEEVAGDLVDALSGCVVAAYNAYFDIKFLRAEMGRAGLDDQIPPHLCLMYLRPMVGVGSRCRLPEACRLHGVPHQTAHMAAADAMASSHLLLKYLDEATGRNIRTFADLAARKTYRFVDSWGNDPYSAPSDYGLTPLGRFRSRQQTVTVPQSPISAYWDVLKEVVADLTVTDEELDYALAERNRLNLSFDQVRALHARAFASVITSFIDDHEVNDREQHKLRKLQACLSRLGWAPGE